MKPLLDVQLDGARTVGAPLKVVAVLRPASAGSVQVKVDGKPSTLVPTDSLRTARIVVSTKPSPSWAGAWRVVDAHIHAPSLSYGSTGPGVVALERRLRELSYAVRDTDGVFDDDDQGAVLAFQKVNGLERTGVVTPQLWSLLANAGVPHARYGGDHVEVDKTRQVLFLVRDGKVVLDDARLDRRHRQHAARPVARLREAAGLGLGALVPELLPARLRHPRLPGGAGVPRVARLRARADVARDALSEQIPMGSAIYIYT